jgi:KaiC/GvpD/RAD55 family RecA-like ATPase
MKFLKTGIAGLDEFLQGGLPPRVLLLMGTPGSGNEVFARQIMYNRAKQNNKITYFTVNTTFESVKDDMAAYGWDITPLIESGNWRFKNLKDSNHPTDDITNEIKENRSIILDSTSELFLKHKTEDAIRLIIEMSNQNRQTQEFQMLLLTEGMQDQQAETTMAHFAEGVINFAVTWTTDSTLRYVIIRKMGGMLVPARRLPYSISKKGFVIETATRIT